MRFFSLDRFETGSPWPRPVAVQKSELVFVHSRRNGRRQVEIEAGLWCPSALLVTVVVAVVDNPRSRTECTGDSHSTPNVLKSSIPLEIFILIILHTSFAIPTPFPRPQTALILLQWPIHRLALNLHTIPLLTSNPA